MDYFNDVPTTFLGFESAAVYLCRVRKLSDLIKDILICVLKINKGLTGLQYTREWCINGIIFILRWTIPFWMAYFYIKRREG